MGKISIGFQKLARGQKGMIYIALIMLIVTCGLVSYNSLVEKVTTSADSTASVDQTNDPGGSGGNFTLAGKPRFCQKIKPQKEIFANYLQLALGGDIGQNILATLRRDNSDSPGDIIQNFKGTVNSLYPSWQNLNTEGGQETIVSPGTFYWLCLEYQTTGYGLLWLTNTNGYPDGYLVITYDKLNNNWTGYENRDFGFKTFGRIAEPIINPAPPPAPNPNNSSNTSESATPTNDSTLKTTASSPTGAVTINITPSIELITSTGTTQTLSSKDSFKITEGQKIKFSGTATANSKITLTIHSSALTKETTVDKNGNWTLILDLANLNLANGPHTISAYASDTTGNKTKEITIAKFNYIKSGTTIKQPISDQNATIIVLGGGVLVLVGILVILWIRRKRSKIVPKTQ